MKSPRTILVKVFKDIELAYRRLWDDVYNLFDGDVSITGDLSVGGDTSLTGDLTVGGDTSLGATTIGDGTNEAVISATGDISLAGTATVWDDIQFATSTAKVPAVNAPSWDVFGTNTKKFTFDINDYVDLESNEVSHSYKEGSNLTWHIHLFTNGLDATDRTVKYKVDYGITNTDGVYSEDSQSQQVTIPANTADRTHLFFNIYEIIGTGITFGADITVRLTRIATDTGTDPSNDPFVSMVGLHIENDAIGSREVNSK